MYQDDDDDKDYNNLPGDDMMKDPVEEGDVLQESNNENVRPVGNAQDVNIVPDRPLVDGNIQEANQAIEDTAEEA